MRFRHAAQGKAEIIQLVLRGRKQKIALVACRVGGAVQFGSLWPFDAADIMAGTKAICTQFPREAEKIGEFHAHIASHARNRRPARHIFIGEMVDHRFAKAAFMVKNIMRNAKLIGDGACVAYVLSGAACPCPFYGATMIIKL